MDKPTVIFDFDGVIHSYTSGWKGIDVIPDPPVGWMKEAIRDIREHYKVVVVSSRCAAAAGIDAIGEWLKKYEIEVDDIMAHKPPAILTIDDRAITFDGNASELLRKIQNFRTWYQTPKYERGDVVQIKPYMRAWNNCLMIVTSVASIGLLRGYVQTPSGTHWLTASPGDVERVGHIDLPADVEEPDLSKKEDSDAENR